MSSATDFGRAGLIFFALITSSTTVLAAAGDRDPTYGQGGRTVVGNLQAGVRLQANRFIQQSDGKTVVVGWTEITATGVPEDFAVVRLNADGSLDTTFDGDGIATIAFNTADQGLAIAEQSDGKLVVAGLTNGAPVSGSTCTVNPCMSVARLESNGALDLTFGGTGKIVIPTPPAGGAAVGVDVVMQGTNIVVGGHQLAFGRLIFARLSSVGVLDPLFSPGSASPGIATVDIGTGTTLRHMTVQADGSLIVVGGANPPAPAHHMSIVRLMSNGILDTSFNGTGRLIAPCNGPCQYIRVVQQPDQKLVFVGYDTGAGDGSPPLRQSRSILERRNLDGSLDASFGSGGRLTNVFANLEPHPVALGEVASGLALDAATGRITVVGRMTAQTYFPNGLPGDTNIRLPIARFTSSGAADTNFGSAGLRMMPTSVGPSGDALGVGWFNVNLLSDGRAMVLGNAGRTISGVTDEGIAVGRLSNGGPGDPGVLTVTGFVVPESAPFAWAVIARTAGSSGSVSASYSTVPVTATAGADFTATTGTLNWADGDVRSKLIKIPLIRDSIAEPADETFQVMLSNLSSGADVANMGVVTIVRDDVAPANTISVVGPTSVSESGGSITFTVNRTGTDPISVNYTTAWDSASGSVAQSPSDYAHVNGILIWGAGDAAPKTISIPIANDTLVESAEELNLAFFLFGGGAVHTNSLTTVMITDDDTPPSPPNPPAGGGGNGGGGGGGGSLSLVWLALLSGVAMVRTRRRLLSRSAG